MTLKSLAGLLLALGLSSTSGAFAASALVQSDDLGAGVAAVATCDPTPGDWVVSFDPSGAATTTSVSVGNIDLGCASKLAELTVKGTANTALTEVSGTIASCTATTCSIAFGISVPTTAVAGIAMVVTG